MNPYLKPTSLSPGPTTKFASHLTQSTSTRSLAESHHYIPSNPNPNISNFSPYPSQVDDQAYYRGGHGVSRVDFSASMGSRPINTRESRADFGPAPTTTTTIYTVNTRQPGSGRSSSIEPGVSSFHDSSLRGDSYSKLYRPGASGVSGVSGVSQVVYRPATIEQPAVPEVKPSYTTSSIQRTAADHKANLEKLQAIIDAAKARQLASGIPRPEQERGLASNYATEPRVYTPGVIGVSSDIPSASSGGQNEKLLSSSVQYRSTGYNYPQSADKYAMRSSGLGASLLQPSKELTSSGIQSSTPLYSKDLTSATGYYSALSAKIDQTLAQSPLVTPTLRPYESAITTSGINGNHSRLSTVSDESKGFSFRDPLSSQETRRLSGGVASEFRSVQAAPRESGSLYANREVQQKVSVLLSPPERLVKKEQGSMPDVPNLSSPLRSYHLEDRAYDGLLSATSESSMKKTLYSIEGTNAAALKMFKETVAELSQKTPEKKKPSMADVQSPFEDLQFALNKENVQISRIIIETVENYSSRGSPSIHKLGAGSESNRGEAEPPVIVPVEPKKMEVTPLPVEKVVTAVEEPKKKKSVVIAEPIHITYDAVIKEPTVAPSSGAEILKNYIKQPPLEEKSHAHVAPVRVEEPKRPSTTSELSQFESAQKNLVHHETHKTEITSSLQKRSSLRSQATPPFEEPTVAPQTTSRVEQAKDHASSLLARIDSALARSQSSLEEGKPGAVENKQSALSALDQFETNRERPITKVVHETPKTESARPASITQLDIRESQKDETKPSLSDLSKRSNRDDLKYELSYKHDLPLQPRGVTQHGEHHEIEVPRPEAPPVDSKNEISEGENRYGRDVSDKILDSRNSRRESSVAGDSRVDALTNQRIVGTMTGMNERIRSFEEFANTVENQPAPVSEHRPTPSISNDEYIANTDLNDNETSSRYDSKNEILKNIAQEPQPQPQKSKFEYSVKSTQEQEEEKVYQEAPRVQNVITHREVLTPEPEPQLVASKPESSKKKVRIAEPETAEKGPETVEGPKKKSTVAVKAVIAILVLFLLGMLGMELVNMES